MRKYWNILRQRYFFSQKQLSLCVLVVSELSSHNKRVTWNSQFSRHRDGRPDRSPEPAQTKLEQGFLGSNCAFFHLSREYGNVRELSR